MIVSEDQAIELLKSGDVVALPTETVYGLAASIDQEKALKKIFETKKRPFFDPLIIHVLNVDQAKKVCTSFGELHQHLADSFWPGPLTLVGTRSDQVSGLITAGLETVAVRSPRHSVFRQVMKGVGTPLAAPSANRFKKTSPTSSDHVLQEFNGSVAVVDGGSCEEGIESTIAEPFWGAGQGFIGLKIYRPGNITAKSLSEALEKKWNHEVRIFQGANSNSKSKTQLLPGEMEDHYQPDCPLILALNTKGEELKEALRSKGFSNPNKLQLSDDMAMVARQLYGALRDAAQLPHDCMVLEKPTWWEHEEADALRDRLCKASSAIL